MLGEATLVARRATVVALASSIAFLAIATTVAADPPTSVDHAVQRGVASLAGRVSHDLPWSPGVSATIARLGSAPTLILVGALAALLSCVRWRSVRPALFLASSYATAVVVTAAFKGGFNRPEPYDRLGERGRSFPSGHTAGSVAVWGTLAVLLWSVPRMRRWAPVPAAVPAAVAVTMVARSAHWVSDVAAGAALGIACVATAAVATGRRSRSKTGPRPALGWCPSSDVPGPPARPAEQPT